MSGSSKTDWTGVFLGLLVLVCAANAFIAFTRPIPQIQPPCDCKPTPTPAPCCKADECRQEFAKVDARFGGVWDELVEVQEQLAKLQPCGRGHVKECCCEPSKPCACSGKPACECRPQQKTQLPVHRILKRCK